MSLLFRPLFATSIATLLLFAGLSVAGDSTPPGQTIAREVFSVWRDITKKEELTHIGRAALPSLPSHKLRLITWNAHKGVDAGWLGDLTWLNDETDLLLIQESTQNIFTGAPWIDLPSKEWKMANSFFTSPSDTTGVLSGSSSQALSTVVLTSPSYEPLTHTPKKTLVTTYSFDTPGCVLMVANMHGINFTGNDELRAQLQLLESHFAAHRGPIVLAGDFNTWNIGRLADLISFAARHGLAPSLPQGDFRFLRLDHVFTRGFEVKTSLMMSAVTSSDHLPIYLELDLNSGCQMAKSH